MIDLLVRAAVTLVALVVISLFVKMGDESFAGASMLLLLFCFEWCYAWWFEAFWHGKTPGKHLMRLRVIKVEGYPVGFYDSMLRNLLRAADVLPFGYGVGLVSVLCSGRFQRLGDIVAGTIVVRETPTPRPGPRWKQYDAAEPLPPEVIRSGPPIPERTILTIEKFLVRAPNLHPRRADEIAGVLAAPLASRFMIPLSENDKPGVFLARIYKSYVGSKAQAEANARSSEVPLTTTSNAVDAPSSSAARDRFLRTRRDAWQEFDTLLHRIERGRRARLSGEELAAFSRLLRAVSYDLATVRSREWGSGLEERLNNLARRGHNQFYRAPPGRLRDVLHFLAFGFPTLLRTNARFFWMSFALFTIPGVIAGLAVWNEPTIAGRVLPAHHLVMMEEMYSEDSWDDHEGGAEAAMAGFYVYNNVGIAFRCFATGVLFGVGTVFFLIYNSIVLGTITSFVIGYGHGPRFLPFVIGHGAFELTAIVVAGAAGLILGSAVVRPQPRTRIDALKARGRDAVRLAAGAGVMLAVAAIIEGFWSPTAIGGEYNNTIKYAVGALLWLVVVAYLALSGRARP